MAQLKENKTGAYYKFANEKKQGITNTNFQHNTQLKRIFKKIPQLGQNSNQFLGRSFVNGKVKIYK